MLAIKMFKTNLTVICTISCALQICMKIIISDVRFKVLIRYFQYLLILLIVIIISMNMLPFKLNFRYFRVMFNIVYNLHFKH